MRDDLVKRAKEEGETVTALVERAIEQYLARSAKTQSEESRLARLGERVLKLARAIKKDD